MGELEQRYWEMLAYNLDCIDKSLQAISQQLESLAKSFESFNNNLAVKDLEKAKRIMDKDVYVEYFNNRILRLLDRLNIGSVEILLLKGRREVASMPGIGQTTLKALDRFMYETHNDDEWFRDYKQIEGNHLYQIKRREFDRYKANALKKDCFSGPIVRESIEKPDPFEDFKDLAL